MEAQNSEEKTTHVLPGGFVTPGGKQPMFKIKPMKPLSSKKMSSPSPNKTTPSPSKNAMSKTLTPSKFSMTKLASSPSKNSELANLSSSDGFPSPAKDSTPKKKYYNFVLQSNQVVMKKQSKMYACDVCTATYRHVFSLKRHFLRNHVTVKYISQSDINNCKIIAHGEVDGLPIVNDSDESMSSRTSESKKRHLSDEPIYGCDMNSDMEGLYRCHLCSGIKFDTKLELKAHYLQHPNTSKVRFPCNKCSAVFSHKQTLLRHFENHASSNIFCCKICEKRFGTKASYIKHMNSHSDNRKCKYCSKILSTTANRKRHERIHEGLKPYFCKRCDAQFSQSSDLKKHLKDVHQVSYFSCHLCRAVFSSKSTLNKHLSEIHSVPQTDDPAREPSPIQQTSKSIVRKKTVASAKSFPCSICKRICPTYISMLRHRRQVHGDYPRARIPRRAKEPQNSIQNGNQKKDSNQWSETEYFNSVSSKIADNLLNHVDGKTEHLSSRQYNFNDHLELSTIVPEPAWATYNFPSNFDNTHFSPSKETEPKTRPYETFLPFTDHFASNSYCDSSSEFSFSCHCDSCSDFTDTEDFYEADFNPHSDFSKELSVVIGRAVQSVLMCCVCKEKFNARDAFDEHCLNNHPGVLCTCIEIESDDNQPPELPEDFARQHLSPVGVYFAYNVPPPISEKPVISCTKCKATFQSAPDLHKHIIDCGGNITTKKHVRKFLSEKKIKNTMKNRMDTTLKPKFSKCVDFTSDPATTANKASSNEDVHRKLYKNLIDFRPKATVGRPRLNLCMSCPHCFQTFRNKTLLNAHRCLKRRVSKKKRFGLQNVSPSLEKNDSLSNLIKQKSAISISAVKSVEFQIRPVAEKDVPSVGSIETLKATKQIVTTLANNSSPSSSSLKVSAKALPTPLTNKTHSQLENKSSDISPNSSQHSTTTIIPNSSSSSSPISLVFKKSVLESLKPIKDSIPKSLIKLPKSQSSSSLSKQKELTDKSLKTHKTNSEQKNNSSKSPKKTIKKLIIKKNGNGVPYISNSESGSEAGLIETFVPPLKVAKAKLTNDDPSSESLKTTVCSLKPMETIIKSSATATAASNDISRTPEKHIATSDVIKESPNKSTNTNSVLLVPNANSAVALPDTVLKPPEKKNSEVSPIPPLIMEFNKASIENKEDNTQGRISPSLEILVNSVNEKLMSDELSPSHPTFSWMEEEHGIIPPQSTSLIKTGKTTDVESTSYKHSSLIVDSETVQDLVRDLTNQVEYSVTQGLSSQNVLSDASSTLNCISSQKQLPSKKESSKSDSFKNSPNQDTCVTSFSNTIQSSPEKSISKSLTPGTKENNNVHNIQESPEKKLAPKVQSAKKPAASLRTFRRKPKSSTASLEDIIQQKIINKPEKKPVHRCSYCMLEFEYFLTFRRHVNICRQKRLRKSKQESSKSCVLHLPKKDVIEESMLNLLRHQTRQSQIMKEVKPQEMKESEESKRLITYTCNICNKIFLSLFKLCQHRVVHKLQNADDQGSSANDTTFPESNSSPDTQTHKSNKTVDTISTEVSSVLQNLLQKIDSDEHAYISSVSKFPTSSESQCEVVLSQSFVEKAKSKMKNSPMGEINSNITAESVTNDSKMAEDTSFSSSNVTATCPSFESNTGANKNSFGDQNSVSKVVKKMSNLKAGIRLKRRRWKRKKWIIRKTHINMNVNKKSTDSKSKTELKDGTSTDAKNVDAVEKSKSPIDLKQKYKLSKQQSFFKRRSHIKYTPRKLTRQSNLQVRDISAKPQLKMKRKYTKRSEKWNKIKTSNNVDISIPDSSASEDIAFSNKNTPIIQRKRRKRKQQGLSMDLESDLIDDSKSDISSMTDVSIKTDASTKEFFLQDSISNKSKSSNFLVTEKQKKMMKRNSLSKVPLDNSSQQNPLTIKRKSTLKGTSSSMKSAILQKRKYTRKLLPKKWMTSSPISISQSSIVNDLTENLDISDVKVDNSMLDEKPLDENWNEARFLMPKKRKFKKKISSDQFSETDMPNSAKNSLLESNSAVVKEKSPIKLGNKKRSNAKKIPVGEKLDIDDNSITNDYFHNADTSTATDTSSTNSVNDSKLVPLKKKTMKKISADLPLKPRILDSPSLENSPLNPFKPKKRKYVRKIFQGKFMLPNTQKFKKTNQNSVPSTCDNIHTVETENVPCENVSSQKSPNTNNASENANDLVPQKNKLKKRGFLTKDRFSRSDPSYINAIIESVISSSVQESTEDNSGLVTVKKRKFKKKIPLSNENQTVLSDSSSLISTTDDSSIQNPIKKDLSSLIKRKFKKKSMGNKIDSDVKNNNSVICDTIDSEIASDNEANDLTSVKVDPLKKRNYKKKDTSKENSKDSIQSEALPQKDYIEKGKPKLPQKRKYSRKILEEDQSLAITQGSQINQDVITSSENDKTFDNENVVMSDSSKKPFGVKKRKYTRKILPGNSQISVPSEKKDSPFKRVSSKSILVRKVAKKSLLGRKTFLLTKRRFQRQSQQNQIPSSELLDTTVSENAGSTADSNFNNNIVKKRQYRKKLALNKLNFDATSSNTSLDSSDVIIGSNAASETPENVNPEMSATSILSKKPLVPKKRKCIKKSSNEEDHSQILSELPFTSSSAEKASPETDVKNIKKAYKKKIPKSSMVPEMGVLYQTESSDLSDTMSSSKSLNKTSKKPEVKTSLMRKKAVLLPKKKMQKKTQLLKKSPDLIDTNTAEVKIQPNIAIQQPDVVKVKKRRRKMKKLIIRKYQGLKLKKPTPKVPADILNRVESLKEDLGFKPKVKGKRKKSSETSSEQSFDNKLPFPDIVIKEEPDDIDFDLEFEYQNESVPDALFRNNSPSSSRSNANIKMAEDFTETEKSVPVSIDTKFKLLKKHTINKSPVSAAERRCPFCKKLFYSLNYKKRHIEIKHKGQGQYVVPKIEKTIAKGNKLFAKKRRAFKRQCKR